MSPLTLSVPEVAKLLGVSARTFDRNLPELQRAGFPRPLPGFPRARFSRAQVEAWCGVLLVSPPTAVPRGADIIRDALARKERLC